MVGTGIGARIGLLIKGGAALESAHATNTIVFDKTGTLTTGRAVIGDSYQCQTNSKHLAEVPEKVQNSDKKAEVLWLAACAEVNSEHPLGKAIINGAKSCWGDPIFSSDGVVVSETLTQPGNGVQCVIENPSLKWKRRTVRVGKRSFASEIVTVKEDQTVHMMADRLRKKGQIVSYISVSDGKEGIIVGLQGIVDPLQVEAEGCCKALKRMGVDVWMCTGDHETNALAVAQEVGIEPSRVCAGVTPEEKAALVDKLKETSGSRKGVAFVGDGINDAVALARADVGIAIGAGTEVAVEAADIVLVRNSLYDVVVALHLSRTVFNRIRINFVWATMYNFCALPFAAGALFPILQWKLPPAFAGLMMAMSSVSVVMSSLMLHTYKAPDIKSNGQLYSGDRCCLSRQRKQRRLPVPTIDIHDHDIADELLDIKLHQML
jgi:Cu+-exporting ATPase